MEKCELYAHPFFKGINWRSLRAKVTPAPYIPRIESNYDAHNFDGVEVDAELSESGGGGAGASGGERADSAVMPKWTREF